ncbi:phospholipase D-like domain-containing protein [Comamonas sp. JC664]|uniref:phospholipase D-like domain-containing protein n=1 Tax=Comamonas sp. JC664 TaxID=2801917 RepID=UPI00362071FE
MVHAKVVVVDDRMGLCGSANLDGRSLFLNYEAMTAFYSAPDIAWLQQWSEQQMAAKLPLRLPRPWLVARCRGGAGARSRLSALRRNAAPAPPQSHPQVAGIRPAVVCVHAPGPIRQPGRQTEARPRYRAAELPWAWPVAAASWS